MKKIIIGAVVAIVVIAGAFYALNSYIYKEKQADFVVGAVAEVTGKVIAVDMQQAMYDGPYIINIESKDGKAHTIAIPSMGLPLCAAYQAKNIGDVSLIKVGDEFEVRGVVGEDGSIVPCASADHYLRPKPLVVTDFEGEADPSRMTLTMKKWSWISALYNDGREIKPKQAGKFTLMFGADGKFTATTDCNSMGGSYMAATDKTIAFSNIFSTKMFCEGSQEGEFAKLLENTASYHFTSKGELIFDLKFDSGSVIFR